MTNIANLLTEHIDIWTAAESEKKSGRGRASGNAGNVYGVKKLRELILELAVRGKLVPQDPNDEPAIELLKRIQAEKAKLIAEGKLKKEKPLTPIGEEEKPFELPNGWGWSKLGQIGLIGSSSRIHQKDWTHSGVPFYRAREIVKLAENGYVDNELFITEDLFETLKNTSVVPEENDVMITGVGTIGVPYVVQSHDRFYFKDASVLIFKNFFNLYTGYLNYFLLSTIWNNKIHSESMGTTVHTLTIERAKEVIVPIPPIAEQHRIVAKVDELMALCDQLEQQHSNAQEAHETLVSQLLATLTQSQNAAEFNANWQRIYAHFDVLFTTEASIDALKKTLLQLAVMGKLVPQDPFDEPASELLKRIHAEKAKLSAEGKLKKEKPLSPIGDDEKPFELAKGWHWLRLGELFTFEYGDNLPEPKRTNTGEYPVYGSNGIVGTHNECFVNSKCIVIGRKGSAGALNLSLSEGCCVTDVAYYCIPHRELDLIFSFKLFHTLGLDVLGKGIKPGLNRNEAYELLIAIPPITEQHRIVAKVDALMALCDQLKTSIQQANQQQQAIADALVAQALKPASAEIIDLAAYRAAITCNIIKHMQHNQAFGRTFAMKLLYLSQQHIGFETHLTFEREAAGPFDKWIYDFERDGVAAGWFGLIEKQLSSGYTKIEYQVKSAIDEPLALMNGVGNNQQRKELERLFTLFADKKTEEAEIAATLFAVWNDFLLNGISPTDEQIIQEVRENWHPSKERFSVERLTKWLNWLQDNNIVPVGKGSKTIYQVKLIH
ncbi:restriction endonuclease subunit S [Methylophilus sp. OH31]|uniref:restriction endonuclease subunit S n=1 Tax=Methylophilus sp. OH31 TaxID=1387312 RepID=UPI000465DF2F|nr:restriction endonuclease subunit S [Methylophilus sp. OH31]